MGDNNNNIHPYWMAPFSENEVKQYFFHYFDNHPLSLSSISDLPLVADGKVQQQQQPHNQHQQEPHHEGTTITNNNHTTDTPNRDVTIKLWDKLKLFPQYVLCLFPSYQPHNTPLSLPSPSPSSFFPPLWQDIHYCSLIQTSVGLNELQFPYPQLFATHSLSLSNIYGLG